MSQASDYLEKIKLMVKDVIEDDDGNMDLSHIQNLPLGQLIAAASEQREIKRAQDKIAKAQGELFKLIEGLIVKAMEAQGDDETPCLQAGSMVDGTRITATITEQEVPSAESWEEIYQYIADNEAWHLLQKRLSATACREEVKFAEVKGMSFYSEKKLALRATKQ